MKLLSVYNICGISGKENASYYIESLNSIFSQHNIDQDVVVSSCLSSNATISRIKDAFPNIKINSINEKVPVNVSFNHTASIFDNNNYNGFLYIDSGIVLNNPNTISVMAQKMNSGPYAMVSCLTDTDIGVAVRPNPGYMRGLGIVSDGISKCIGIGSSINLHCQIFSREIKTFYNNIIPDIFAGFCTESIFTFICAAIKKRWSIIDNILVNHNTSLDGPSLGFSPAKWVTSTGRETFDHPFILPTYMNRIFHPLAKKYGLGFEECRNVLLHDANQYDKDMFCINDELKFYIKNNLYLQPTEFDYTNINHNIIN